MRKLYASEKRVLKCLIFPESYNVILEETGLAIGTLRDDLINLINFRFIEVMDANNSEPVATSFYDSDNLQDFSFRATIAGLKQIQENHEI